MGEDSMKKKKRGNDSDTKVKPKNSPSGSHSQQIWLRNWYWTCGTPSWKSPDDGFVRYCHLKWREGSKYQCDLDSFWYYTCTKWWGLGKSVLCVKFLTAFVTSTIQTNPKVHLNILDQFIKHTSLVLKKISGHTYPPIKNIWYPPSFPNRMNCATRTLPAVVLFHSHSSLAHIFLCESTPHQSQGLQLPASAPLLPDNRRLDKPFLTLAFSMVWPLIWLECFNELFKTHLSIRAQSVSSSSLSDFWGGRNGGGQVFNSFEVYDFSSLMKVGKR